jgi:ribonuclease VapC
MILDTSAILAIIRGEVGSERLEELIAAQAAPRMSAATAAELNAVITRRLPPEKVRLVSRLLRAWNVEIVPFDEEQSKIASRAYADYGKGSGHPAQLNLGDCFSYALAAATSAPLLFVGSDFSRTDVEPAHSTSADQL